MGRRSRVALLPKRNMGGRLFLTNDRPGRLREVPPIAPGLGVVLRPSCQGLVHAPAPVVPVHPRPVAGRRPQARTASNLAPTAGRRDFALRATDKDRFEEAPINRRNNRPLDQCLPPDYHREMGSVCRQGNRQNNRPSTGKQQASNRRSTGNQQHYKKERRKEGKKENLSVL